MLLAPVLPSRSAGTLPSIAPGCDEALVTGPAQPEAEAQPSAAPNPEVARTAARGGLAIAVAKVSFILLGFVQQVALPYVLGVDGYGAISKVFAVVGIVNNVIVAVALQGVSRSVASVPVDRAPEALRKTLGMHVVLALAISTAFALLASSIADWIKSPHITEPLRLVALVVLLYGVYAPLVGSLNGLKRFVDQAGLDILYGVMRATLTIGVAYFFVKTAGDGVLGAAVGFVLTAAIIVPIAMTRSGIGRRGTAGPTVQEYATFLAPLAVGQISLNLLLQTDFMLLSRFVGGRAETLGLGAEAADSLVGVYRGVQLFAFLPYQMLMSVTFVLFPMLARAFAEGDKEGVRRYAVTGVRLAVILTGLIAGTISALGPLALRFAFPPEIADRGGEALRIAALGMGAFAILGIASAALTSLKRERVAAVLTIAAVILVAGGCIALVPRAEFGSPMLVASAIATGTAMLVLTVVAGFALRGAAGGFVSPLTLARVGAAVALAHLAGRAMPYLGKMFVLVEAIALVALYLVVLVALRELGKADVATLRAALGRRSAAKK
jgi:stage V sporulation protein B